MRHFAAELRELGYKVDYYPGRPNFASALDTHLAKYRPAQVRLMESAEYGGADRLAQPVRARPVEVEVTPNNMFLSDRAEFAKWARDKKTLLPALRL